MESLILVLASGENSQNILYEKDEERKLVSAKSIHSLDELNLTESNLIDAAEHLLKETQSDMSLCSLVNTITKTKNTISTNLFCDYEQSNLLHNLALKGKTVSTINVNKNERKIDISLKSCEEKWNIVELISFSSYDYYNRVFIPKKDQGCINGLNDEIGIRTRLGVFLSLGSETTKYIIEKSCLFDINDSEIEKIAFRLFVSLIVNKQISSLPKDKNMDLFEKSFHNKIEKSLFEHISDDIKDVLWRKIDREELLKNLYLQKNWIYDIYDWSRREDYII